MKKSALILSVLLGLFASLWFLNYSIGREESLGLAQANRDFINAEGTQSKFPELDGTLPQAKSLIQKMILQMKDLQLKEAASHVMQKREYEAIYPFTLQGSTKEQDAKFIASMYLASNVKHLNRWSHTLNRVGVQEVVSIKLKTEPKKHHGFELIQIEELKVRTQSGEIQSIEPFKTLVKTAQGYKIWSILDT